MEVGESNGGERGDIYRWRDGDGDGDDDDVIVDEFGKQAI